MDQQVRLLGLREFLLLMFPRWELHFPERHTALDHTSRMVHLVSELLTRGRLEAQDLSRYLAQLRFYTFLAWAYLGEIDRTRRIEELEAAAKTAPAAVAASSTPMAPIPVTDPTLAADDLDEYQSDHENEEDKGQDPEKDEDAAMDTQQEGLGSAETSARKKGHIFLPPLFFCSVLTFPQKEAPVSPAIRLSEDLRDRRPHTALLRAQGVRPGCSGRRKRRGNDLRNQAPLDAY